MKIYFSCSITGGRQDQPVYRMIVDELLANGYTVLTASLAAADLDAREGVGSDTDVYQRDIAWLDECDLVIAEISTPSHGVGYEIAYALLQGKPVFCLYQEGCVVSKMLTGNDHPGMKVFSYTDGNDALRVLKACLG